MESILTGFSDFRWLASGFSPRPTENPAHTFHRITSAPFGGREFHSLTNKTVLEL